MSFIEKTSDGFIRETARWLDIFCELSTEIQKMVLKKIPKEKKEQDIFWREAIRETVKELYYKNWAERIVDNLWQAVCSYLFYRISDLNFRDDVEWVMLEKRGVIKKEEERLKGVVWNDNSVRILYETWIIWHFSIQIWSKIYTYSAKWEWFEFLGNAIKWLLPGLWDANISEQYIEDRLTSSENFEIYDLKFTENQKGRLQNFIDDYKKQKISYSIIWENCVSFVQACLIASWIDVKFEEWIWWNIPWNYNDYLKNIFNSINSYIKNKYEYNFSKFNNLERKIIINLIEKSYWYSKWNLNYIKKINNIWN